MSGLWAAATAVVVSSLLVLTEHSAPAVRSQPAVIETSVASSAPDSAVIAESFVSIYAPLPASYGSHPAACDRLGYLRFRSTAGPLDPTRANAIYIAQPGLFEGAGAMDQVARNTIVDAAAAGHQVEFWALSRRSNCLTDDWGQQAAVAAHNPQLAIDYYFGNKTVHGRKFAGFVSETSASFLANVGLAQTAQDEYAIVSRLPVQVRQSKVLCGGHSLGAVITGVFANWDFSPTNNGDPAYAGYSQCAGYFSLDSRFSTAAWAHILAQSLGPIVGSVLQLASTGVPYVNFPPFTPEVYAVMPILGLASYYLPGATNRAVISQLPNDFNFQFTYRFLFANDWLNFFTDKPDIRDYNATNQATVGVLFSDVTEPIAILRTSLGIPTGGPVVAKTFPVAYGASSLLGLVGGSRLIAPKPSSATRSGPLYSWLNYNEVPTQPLSPLDRPGQPYSSAASEVSDIEQFSRTLFDAPVRFTEDYFPIRLITDVVSIGNHAGSMARLRYTDGITRHPAAYIDAQEGIIPSLGFVFGAIPNGPAPQVHVVAPGYNHLDVTTAAAIQSDGSPEIVSKTLANWMATVVG